MTDDTHDDETEPETETEQNNEDEIDDETANTDRTEQGEDEDSAPSYRDAEQDAPNIRDRITRLRQERTPFPNRETLKSAPWHDEHGDRAPIVFF